MTAILLQTYVALLLSIEFVNNGLPDNHATTILTTGLCCLFSLLQYNYLRHHKPPRYSAFFTRFDKHDIATIFAFLAGMVSGYLMAMSLSHSLLQQFYQGELAGAFTASQSLIINGTALLLMGLAATRQNKELRNISILLTLVGGGKVFLIDMLQVNGAWLVVSIFSFGIAAALESLVLARWKPDTAPDLGPENSIPTTRTDPQEQISTP